MQKEEQQFLAVFFITFFNLFSSLQLHCCTQAVGVYIMGIKAALPKYELYFYNTVLCLAMFWAASWIFEVSSSNANRKTFKTSVKPGWYYFGKKMETADFEWVMWFSTFREHILFALSGHVIFAKICSMLAPQHRSLVYMVYGVLAVWTTMGWTYVTLILSHCILLYSISLVKIRWLCFVMGLTTLATFKCEPFVSWQAGFVTGSFELRPVLFYGGCGFTILRCMSFALENCERREGNYSILELLKFNFYLPFFYFGPIITFDKYYIQANRSDLTRKEREMWNISLQGLIHLGAIILVDVLFHFMYILTIPTDMKLLKHLSDWALVGLAYYNLVYDWVKAAVMFGVINTVSRLDHLDPPQPPKCITMLYVFAETHFDRGINDWLCKYVYDYLGGKHENVLDEFIATVCTFGVTIMWLGPCQVVFIWAFFNCFGLNFELWTAKFFSMEPLASLEMAMSEAMSRRIRAIFNTFNFWTIVLYNVLALNSLDFAKLVAKRLLLKGFPITTILVMFLTYCLVQLIKERERKQALIDDPDPSPPPAPAPPPTLSTTTTTTTTIAAQPVMEPEKEKAE
ncbi:protein-cysteine N-palmitoyltransferase HHAT-like protein isoform X1 [Hypomesus transpacificus]|uniref:protein-cysteine N-palmitoyltransferase HHAT-like protein isoform X1 n=2 Tax=Hypomesus transpacificus TaxID=137520 RepID=UPI001F0791A6|nr:protein-cysteine N-palmitoyltransferase HHAT-like protein isoform X1 [Hypomesus transpacificus]